MANWRDAVVASELQPVVLGRPVTVVLFGAAMVASEVVRDRYDVRVGVIAVGLLALYALASVWLLVLYAVVIVVTYAVVHLLHRRTLLYGRVLIGIAGAFALLLALPTVLALPVQRGLSAYFVALVAGINAYNVHVTASRYRRLVPFLQVAAFLPLLAAARLVSRPLPRGIPQELTPVVVVVGALLTLACLAVAERATVRRPSEEAVYRDSVLSGGGDA
ncbi:poly-gamma-glutamate biosynthesis protein PgsC/CapC [Halosegnis marinus]|uniref:poly-gamma-glutamate biosynthesis protein PgsC/CapC n=1 Tax=Halosegnis marinus TaxID=3034023 RepID=UPI003619B73B